MANPVRSGGTFTVSSQNSNAQFDSQTTVLANGQIVTVWTDLGSNFGDIKFRIFNPDGTPAGAEQTMAGGTTGQQGQAVVVALSTGGFAIAATDFQSDPGGNIRYATYNAAGTLVGSVGFATTDQGSIQQRASIAALDGGQFVIAWEDYNTTTNGLGSVANGAIMARTFNANGSAATGPVRISGDWGGDGAPDLAGWTTAVPDGGLYIAAWDDSLGPIASANGEDGIYLSFNNSEHNSLNEPGGIRIDNDAGFRESSVDPAVAFNAGVAAIAWMDDRPGTVGDDIFLRFGSFGPVRVNTVTVGDQSRPDVAFLGNGDVVVVWQSFSSASSFDIKARVYNGQTGEARGVEFLVNSPTSPTFDDVQNEPSVSALYDGRFVVSWSDPGFNGGINAQIFDPRTAGVTWTGDTVARWYVGTRFVDTLTGGTRNDTILGGAGNDRFNSSAGIDQLDGEGGVDTVSFLSEASGIRVTLAAGAPAIVRSAAGQVIERLIDIENVIGTSRADSITGDARANVLQGQLGSDTLGGGAGRDVLIGGFGDSDLFVFQHTGAANVDRIDDFAGADRIGLSRAVFAALGPTVTASEFRVGTAATTADHHLIYNSATGQLFYDRDGAGGAAQVIVALLDGSPAVAFNDFVMI